MAPSQIGDVDANQLLLQFNRLVEVTGN